jgi:hypothetical protein
VEGSLPKVLFLPGREKTGGRPKGGYNRKTQARKTAQELADEAARQRLEAIRRRMAETLDAAAEMPRTDPLDVMHSIMKTSFELGDRAMALQAANSLAPFLHAKLLATDVTLRNDNSKDLSDSELMQKIELMTRALEHSGQLRPSTIEGHAVAAVPVENPDDIRVVPGEKVYPIHLSPEPAASVVAPQQLDTPPAPLSQRDAPPAPLSQRDDLPNFAELDRIRNSYSGRNASGDAATLAAWSKL